MTVTTAPTNVAFDFSACIHSQSEIGKTITHNICTGETAVVPWGALDWLAVLGFGGLCGVIGVMLVVLVAVIVRSYWEGW